MKFYELFQKYGRLSLIGLSVLVMVVAYFVYSGNYSKVYDQEYKAIYKEKSNAFDVKDPKVLEVVEVNSADEASKQSMMIAAGQSAGIGFVFTYILIGIAVLSAILLPIVVTRGEIKTLKKMLIGLAILLTILFICYMTSNGNAVGSIDASTVKLSDMIINSSIALVVVGFVAVVVSEVRSIIKS